MVFSSLTFIFYFYPVCFLIYYILPKNIVIRNLWFLICSLFFYYWGEKEFIIILFLSIVLNYVFGILIEKTKSKALVAIGVMLNLAILVYYKYIGFLMSTIFSWPYLSEFFEQEQLYSLNYKFGNIHLPLGISFFTFQGISYIVDVSRSDERAERNLINLALYIAMFPQLIAGPIVRYKTIIAEIRHRNHDLSKIIQGITLFVIGLGYKVLLANILANPADAIFNLNQEVLTASVAWLGILAYTFQIYFDFCGYSTMAIGLGLMVGFKLPANFNYPYISTSITEFWRRWHITLSQWFRDYLYIPLGGNRVGTFNTYRNLLMVFVLCGIWHGAAWTFLFWGIYQGFFLVIERFGFNKILAFSPKFFQHIYTMIVVMCGWVLFRAESMTQTLGYYKTMFSFNDTAEGRLLLHEQLSNDVLLALIGAIIFSTPLMKNLFFKIYTWESLSEVDKYVKPNSSIVWYLSLLVIFILSISSLSNATYNPFIYYRF